MSDTTTKDIAEYNYCNFKAEYYNFSEFKGAKPGEKALDFDAFGLDGEKVKLSDYFGTWLVLETGSFSCPMYVGNIQKMNQVAKEFPDVRFLVLYIREAHPGSSVPPHKSIEEKLDHAKRLPGEENEERTIIVDTIDGNAHKLYGSYPDAVYIINPEGTVVFRSDWTIASNVKEVLLQGRDEIHKRDHFEPGAPSIPLAFRVLIRAGLNSLWDFTLGLPKLMTMHKDANKAYSKRS
ncbi:MAG: deiodinase-like protein [Thermodesulfobacteriota bacterium]